MTHLDKRLSKMEVKQKYSPTYKYFRTEVNRETTVVFAQYIVVMVWSWDKLIEKASHKFTWISYSPDVMETHSFTEVLVTPYRYYTRNVRNKPFNGK